MGPISKFPAWEQVALKNFKIKNLDEEISKNKNWKK